ncbi:MAG: MarC family protein [Bacteroidales bacterium]|nr:MarC family protein [Candidatus Sodaliphilus fimicaballi]
MFSTFSITETLSAFLVLIGIIDIIGSIPIILQIKSTGKHVSATKATIYSWLLMVGFFYGGDLILKMFGCDIQSFASAGAILILLMSLEMILDVELFKNSGPIKDATLVPLVFPLLAGAGSFTTLISMKAMYSDLNIMIALALNMLWVFIVIRLTDKIQNLLGKSGIYFIRKFFGIILMAIAVKMFTENFSHLWK